MAALQSNTFAGRLVRLLLHPVHIVVEAATLLLIPVTGSLLPLAIWAGLEATVVALAAAGIAPPPRGKAAVDPAAGLSGDAADRVRRLDERRKLIVRQAGENRRLGGASLAREVERLEGMVGAFADIARAVSAWDRHLAGVDLEELEAEIRRAESDAERALDEERRDLAKKNLAVLQQRREELGELRGRAAKARAQLDLIENTFQLIADQVQAMESPGEIDTRLDDIVVGVEAVREMAGGRAHARQGQRG